MGIRFNPSCGCCCVYDFPGWTVYHNNVSEGNHFYTLDIARGTLPSYNLSNSDNSGCYVCFTQESLLGGYKFPLQFLFQTSPNIFQTCQSVSGQYYIRMELEKSSVALTGTNPTNTWVKAAKIKQLDISGFPDYVGIPGESSFAFDDTRSFYGFGNHYYGHNFSGCLTGVSGVGQKPNLVFNLTPYVAARVSSDDKTLSGIFSIGPFSGVYSPTNLHINTVSGFYNGLTNYIASSSITILENSFSGAFSSEVNRRQQITSGVLGYLRSYKYCLDFQPSSFCRPISFCDSGKTAKTTYTAGTKPDNSPVVSTYYSTGDYWALTAGVPNSDINTITSFFPAAFISITCDGLNYSSGINYSTGDIMNFLSGRNISYFDGYFTSGAATTTRMCQNYVPENPILAMASVLSYSEYISGSYTYPTFLTACEFNQEINAKFGIWIYDNIIGGHCLNELVKSDFYDSNIYGGESYSCFSYTSVDDSGNLVPPCYNNMIVNLSVSPDWDMYQTNVPNSDLC